MPDQYKNFSQLARVATTASAQLKQAYWAVRGTKISIMYVERDTETAGETKERLAA